MEQFSISQPHSVKILEWKNLPKWTCLLFWMVTKSTFLYPVLRLPRQKPVQKHSFAALLNLIFFMFTLFRGLGRFPQNSLKVTTWFPTLPKSKGILLSHKKEWNWVICRGVAEPRDGHTEWNKSEIERQIIYINTYMWNLEKMIFFVVF